MDNHNTFERMRQEGGSFASKLAEAWFYADPNNKRKIEEAFADLIGPYKEG